MNVARLEGGIVWIRVRLYDMELGNKHLIKMTTKNYFKITK